MRAELNPYVRIAVIADLNSNLNALQAVIQDAESRGIKVFLNAGETLDLELTPTRSFKTILEECPKHNRNFDLSITTKEIS
jgi:hypothetical protein